MEDVFYTILGLGIVYTWIHFLVIQHKKAWNKRTNYEQIITILAVVTAFFVYLGSS